MDNKLLGEQIARYRKERNLTQEELGRAVGVSTQAVSRWENGGAPDVALLPAIADKLGVTIDALFGREGGERADVRDVVARWARGVPKEQRLDQFCRLIWSLLIRGGLTEVELPNIEYPARAKFSLEDGDDRLLLSRFQLDSGLVMDLHTEDLSFVTIWPEPEAAAKQMDMPLQQVKELLEAMHERQMLWSMQLELTEGTVTAYELAEHIGIVPFLYMARCVMQRGANLTYQVEKERPVFRGGLWKDEMEKKDEKK